LNYGFCQDGLLLPLTSGAFASVCLLKPCWSLLWSCQPYGTLIIEMHGIKAESVGKRTDTLWTKLRLNTINRECSQDVPHVRMGHYYTCQMTFGIRSSRSDATGRWRLWHPTCTRYLPFVCVKYAIITLKIMRGWSWKRRSCRCVHQA
jgi:hypothetical protein